MRAVVGSVFAVALGSCGGDRGGSVGPPLSTTGLPGDTGADDGDPTTAGGSTDDGGPADTGGDDGAPAAPDLGSSDDGGADSGGAGTTGGGMADGTVPGNAELGLASSPEAPSIPGGTAQEREVLDIINQIRADNGIPALAWNDEIADAARSHVYDMGQLGYFSHGSSTNQGGHLYNDRVQWLYPGSYVYGLENLYWGGGSPQTAVDVWMGSAGHRPTILDEIPGVGATKFGGVGVVDGIYGLMTAK